MALNPTALYTTEPVAQQVAGRSLVNDRRGSSPAAHPRRDERPESARNPAFGVAGANCRKGWTAVLRRQPDQRRGCAVSRRSPWDNPSAQMSSCLVDNIVRHPQQSSGHLEPEFLRRLEIDDKSEMGRLLDRKIRGLGPSQNAIDQLNGAVD